jgi:hypothetical protein
MTIAEQDPPDHAFGRVERYRELDRLHDLIPPDACKIDNLSQATPAKLKQLKDGLAITQAMQELRRKKLDSES